MPHVNAFILMQIARCPALLRLKTVLVACVLAITIPCILILSTRASITRSSFGFQSAATERQRLEIDSTCFYLTDHCEKRYVKPHLVNSALLIGLVFMFQILEQPYPKTASACCFGTPL